MKKRNIIVIGASTGGFDAIRQLVSELPADMDASIFIVVHISPEVSGMLPEILNQQKGLPASNAVDNEPIRSGRIYVAPPDHHMVLTDGMIRVTRGPKENRFRPAIDPLFRSAAYTYGSQVIGVILTGALDDGSAGLWAVKQRGGIAVVQDPAEAQAPSMPESALRVVEVDHKLPLSKIAPLLTEISAQNASPSIVIPQKKHLHNEREIEEAVEEEAMLKQGVLEFGQLTPYTCPECNGVLSSIVEGNNIRFRCHTGHAFSTDTLLAAITGNIEDSLWRAVRSIHESILFLNHMGDHFAEHNLPKLAAMYFKKAKDAEKRAQLVRQVVLDHELLTVKTVEEQAKKQ